MHRGNPRRHPLDSGGRRHQRIRRRDERGEGVISMAIAVLIVAFLGVAMWAGFQQIFADARDTTSRQVELIGQ